MEAATPRRKIIFHHYPTIKYLLSLDPAEFHAAYPRETARASQYLRDLQERGFTYLPLCDHHDPKTGRCLGHGE